MWEAIRANRRRSTWLMLAMGAVLIALGASLGILGVSWAGQPALDDQLLGALLGSVLAIVVWLGSWIYTAADGDGMVLRSVGARRIEKADHPRLWNIVEEMSIAAGLKKMPGVYVIDSSAPNAFAVGHTPDNSSVAFTSTLLRTLNRDELQGVAAHEIGHIVNEDVRFMTQAAVLVGGVELLSQFLIRLGPLGGHGRRIAGAGGGGGGNKGGGGGAAPLMAIAFLVAILSPLAIRLLYYACSRTREYLADASAARLTRYPDGLASALEKIAAHQMTSPATEVNSAVAPLYIVNPLERLQLSGISSTHPPTSNRVKILRAMGGGAGYVDYEAALKKVEGERLRLPELELAARTGERLRSRSADPNQDPLEDPVSRAHAALDLIDVMAGYTTVLCQCGLRVKTPPESNAAHIGCPRCGRVLNVPRSEAEKASQPVALPAAAEVNGALSYQRAASDWEAFSCSCGQTIQLGAGYPLDYTICAKCDRRIEIARKS